MTRMKHVGVALVALLGASGVASAQPAPPGRPEPPPRPPAIDTNKDGVVTRAEAGAAADALFARLDENGDGALTPTDKPSRGGDRVFERRFETKDGREIRIERREFRGPGGPDGPGGHGGPGGPPRPPHPPMGLLVFASMEEADANGDGKVSKDEFRAMQLRFFDAADVNGDGKIKAPPMPPEPPEPPEPPAPPPPPR